MQYIEAFLEGLPDRWVSGLHIIDVSITVGQNQMSNSCEIVLADVGGNIAARLIQHSLRSGGIVKLEPEEVAANTTVGAAEPFVDATGAGSQPTDAQGWEKAIVQSCLNNGITDRNQIAYVLATAQIETTMGANLEELASGAAYEGRRDLGNTSPGDGKRYKGRGLVQVTGKRNYSRLSGVLGVDLIAKPELLKEARYALPSLTMGMRTGFFTGRKLSDFINGSKVDFVGARRIVNGQDKATEIAALASNVYVPKVNSLVNAANGSTTAIAKKVDTKDQDKTKDNQADAPVKGNKLTVSIGGYSFEFFHQGTDHNQDGVTRITGQGIRWVLNRRVRNKTEKNLKLSELALKVAKAHKLKLKYEAAIDPTYLHVDQTNITDYQLLKRECDRCGLFLSEAQGYITIKSLSNIVDAHYTATLGYNLISYNIKDAAVDTTNEDQGSALMQAEAKIDLNPITGQFEQRRLDLDKAKDISTSGKDKTTNGATLLPGQDAIIDANKARVKRVKGLPSTFVVPTTEETLALLPMMAFRTVGLAGVLSRVWLIDSVRHNAAQGTTTIDCYAPIDVIVPMDSQPTSGEGSPNDTPTETPATAVTNKNNAIYQAAIALRGMSSRNAPNTNGGRVACVWAVNAVLAKAGVGNTWNSSLAVKDAKRSLQSNATKITVSQAKPGDIVLWDGAGSRQHIGIVLADGATSVISNSSSKASFTWVSSYLAQAAYYGGAPTEIYRLK